MKATARLRPLARIAAILALAALGPTAFAQHSNAAPGQACRQLEAQLAAASRPAGGQARRYDKAIRAQELELEKTRARAANGGCGGFFGALRGQCGPLNAAISRMESNLASLRQQRGGVGGSPVQERARLQEQLAAHGCRAAPREAAARPAAPQRTEQPFGGKITHRQRTPSDTGTGLRAGSAATGNYRTLCVRTCDGYFFPIAYSSSPSSFDQDLKSCEAACPGTEVELFRHRVPSEEAEAAVSTRSGRAYGDLPNAFLYRKAGYQRPTTCGCNVPRGFSVIAGASYKPSAPVPVQAADLAATAADVPSMLLAEAAPNAAASALEEVEPGDVPDLFAEQSAVAPDEQTSSVGREEPVERRVRVVGPTFLPDPEEAIDLRAPGRKAGR